MRPSGQEPLTFRRTGGCRAHSEQGPGWRPASQRPGGGVRGPGAFVGPGGPAAGRLQLLNCQWFPICLGLPPGPREGRGFTVVLSSPGLSTSPLGSLFDAGSGKSCAAERLKLNQLHGGTPADPQFPEVYRSEGKKKRHRLFFCKRRWFYSSSSPAPPPPLLLVFIPSAALRGCRGPLSSLRPHRGLGTRGWWLVSRRGDFVRKSPPPCSLAPPPEQEEGSGLCPEGVCGHAVRGVPMSVSPGGSSPGWDTRSAMPLGGTLHSLPGLPCGSEASDPSFPPSLPPWVQVTAKYHSGCTSLELTVIVTLGPCTHLPPLPGPLSFRFCTLSSSLLLPALL